ncbi:MAG: Anaerobic sulfatase-maturating enzyme [Candidatus Ordinivivax streblomastigis]|uniref:Anaerobic sulfatase-maturating enzyme n=1 Tax=Candidatus Ordinivivax streblomastigis TaxID=2540710 RepID=A0A5M8P5A2_9BACT|nr:MAG: Anaerobic sulfatase-maturating enzyme [Candidatus Ordinivivax streblomastigis]
MKFSKYVHFYPIADNTIGVYHSLLLETLFLEKKEVQNINTYFATNVLTDKQELKNTVEYLYQHYFIVESDEEDKDMYSKSVDLITQPIIENVFVIVTESCNFNCKYCFVNESVNSNRKDKLMTEDVAKATVALLQKTYEQEKSEFPKIITFFGGEPLLNFKIIKTFIEEIEHVKTLRYWPEDVKYSVVTNASLLTSNMIDFFKQNDFTLGISFDIDKDAHSERVDKNGNDTFNLVREKIDLCKEKEIQFTLSITITETLIKNRNKIIAEILSIKPHDISFNLLLPSKNQEQNNKYYEDATDFIIEMFQIFREHGIYEDRIMRKVKAFTENHLYLFDCCAAGGSQYVIAPKGEIGICHGFLNNRKYFSSSVFDENFNPNTNENFKYWRDRTPLLMEKCLDCECLGICGGGCPYAAEFAHGSIYELDERFCVHAKRLLRWLINDLFNITQINETVDNNRLN